MKLRINITKDILRRSMMCGAGITDTVSENCAIALAVRDIFLRASVGLDNIEIDYTTDDPIIVPLPLEAREFIEAFDTYARLEKFEARLQMDEFSFDIDIPQSVLDTINIDEITAIINRVDHLELV